MLDYRDIIIKHFALHLSGREIAERLGASKSGVNDFLRALKTCGKIPYPLPEGITNYMIQELVYGAKPERRDTSFELPEFQDVAEQMRNRKNMTLVHLWRSYKNRCLAAGTKFYSYRQFCEQYARWTEENAVTLHFNTVIGEKIEVDFAGKTFERISSLSGEKETIVVFVAVLPYSQYIYAEGMLSTKEPHWIEVNNHMLVYFGGVTPLIVCDNCKQAVLANKDWIEPDLNKDYQEWAEHNHTVIMPAKIRKAKYKSSVECSVGILEKGFFHDLEEMTFYSLEDFNLELWNRLAKLNQETFAKRNETRYGRFLEERAELLPLPSTYYQYMERKTAKVSSDFHIRYDNSYYSCPKQYLHQQVQVRATATTVKIYSQKGELLREGPRAQHKGEWLTDINHLPKEYTDYLSWSGPYFLQKAMAIGPSTHECIRRILKSQNYEVQTYRRCAGVLGFAKKYSKKVLESCCKEALDLNHVTYTYIKNTIPALAEGMKVEEDRQKRNAKKNEGAFIMEKAAASTEYLLAKSKQLLEQEGRKNS